MPTGNSRNPTIGDKNDETVLVSKSQLKREALAKKSLAAELLELSAAQLSALPLDPGVLSAVEQAQGMRSHGARKRQLMYIAKLLRRLDETELAAAVEELNAKARGVTAAQHRVEAWRTLLLDKGDAALTVLLDSRDIGNAQTLRQLVRKARQEKEAGKPPAASRALFRELRTLDDAEPLPPASQIFPS